MLTVQEYLDLSNKNPNPNSTWKTHVHYEGEEEDYNKLIEYNKELCAMYPFLKPKDWRTGAVYEDYNYTYTELDNMEDGWRLAFGMEMCEEIKQALLKAQSEDPNGGYKESHITTNYDSDKIIPYLEGYQILQIKEKYAQLRWYDNGATKEVEDIISKYESISECTCGRCGKKAKYYSKGWIYPFCEECANKDLDKHNSYEDRSRDYTLEDLFTPMKEME